MSCDSASIDPAGNATETGLRAEAVGVVPSYTAHDVAEPWLTPLEQQMRSQAFLVLEVRNIPHCGVIRAGVSGTPYL